MEADDARGALARIAVQIVSDRPKLNVVRGVVSVVVCLTLIALVVAGRDVIAYALSPVRSLGLMCAGLSLFMLPAFAWQWGTGQVTRSDIKSEWKMALAMGVLVLFGLFSWLFEPIQNVEIECEVCGIHKEYEWGLTPVYKFHCKKDAIDKAEQLDKTRVEWAKDDDGKFVEYEVEIKSTERWPVFDGLNKALGTRIGVDSSSRKLSGGEYRGNELLEAPAGEPREYFE